MKWISYCGLSPRPNTSGGFLCLQSTAYTTKTMIYDGLTSHAPQAARHSLPHHYTIENGLKNKETNPEKLYFFMQKDRSCELFS